ncbi:SAM-dependent methyltransferase [Streptomyces sp. NPDC046881]|uniref:SAM-dependent methyltransferase n=1 Tax=Streptomyces sp. NPDC046881 TaxID=3155374 RepID=UPI0033C68242
MWPAATRRRAVSWPRPLLAPVIRVTGQPGGDHHPPAAGHGADRPGTGRRTELRNQPHGSTVRRPTGRSLPPRRGRPRSRPAADHGPVPRPPARQPENGAVSDALRRFLSVRTWWFDRQLLAAARSGCRQVVLLGAGLDTRAFRLDWPPATRMFELDGGEVLAFKNHVLATERAHPRCGRESVPVDLTTAWAPALIETGFDPVLATAWLAEGLLMYLDRAGLDRLLASITELSGRGCRLAAEHGNAALHRLPFMQDMARRRAALGITRKSSMEDPHRWLAEHGWRAQAADPMTLATETGRRLPDELDPRRGSTARLWLTIAHRIGDAQHLADVRDRPGVHGG